MCLAVLHDNHIFGVVTINFLFCEQVSHPPIGEGETQPKGEIVIDLRAINTAVTFQQSIAFARTGYRESRIQLFGDLVHMYKNHSFCLRLERVGRIAVYGTGAPVCDQQVKAMGIKVIQRFDGRISYDSGLVHRSNRCQVLIVTDNTNVAKMAFMYGGKCGPNGGNAMHRGMDLDSQSVVIDSFPWLDFDQTKVFFDSACRPAQATAKLFDSHPKYLPGGNNFYPVRHFQ